MPGFNTLPAVGGGGGQANMTFVASVHMNTYNRSWAQAGTAGYYGMYSTNQENGYVYFVGSGITTGAALNKITNVTHAFTRIDIIAPQEDMISLYKAKVKSTTSFPNPFAGFASFPSTITSSGNFVLPNNALPLVNVLVGGAGGGGGHHSGGGGGGGGFVKLTAYQAVGTTAVTVAAATSGDGGRSYFGNVYSLGGGKGGDHNANGNGGSEVVTGGGAGGHTNNLQGGVGVLNAGGPAAGAKGAPTWQPTVNGRTGGGGITNSAWTQRGGGGAGIAENGYAHNVNDARGGVGVQDDITGTNTYYGHGGQGGAHQGPGGGGNGQGLLYGGGSTNGHNPGGSGMVVVRYYIP